jgi:hypothetical protein
LARWIIGVSKGASEHIMLVKSFSCLQYALDFR